MKTKSELPEEVEKSKRQMLAAWEKLDESNKKVQKAFEEARVAGRSFLDACRQFRQVSGKKSEREGQAGQIPHQEDFDNRSLSERIRHPYDFEP